MALNERSVKNLQGVHPDLVRVVERAAELEPFLVTEGLRTLDRQKKLKAAGKSKTLNSRHLTGHAVDLCDMDGCYDIPDMKAIAKAMKKAALELETPLEWGGDWKKFVDTPHFQLPWKEYPAKGVSTVEKVIEAAKTRVAVGVGAAGGSAVITEAPMPAPPDLTPWLAWKGFGEAVSGLGSWAIANPLITVCIAAWIGCTIFWTQIRALVGRSAHVSD